MGDRVVGDDVDDSTLGRGEDALESRAVEDGYAIAVLVAEEVGPNVDGDTGTAGSSSESLSSSHLPFDLRCFDVDAPTGSLILVVVGQKRWTIHANMVIRPFRRYGRSAKDVTARSNGRHVVA